MRLLRLALFCVVVLWLLGRVHDGVTSVFGDGSTTAVLGVTLITVAAVAVAERRLRREQPWLWWPLFGAPIAVVRMAWTWRASSSSSSAGPPNTSLLAVMCRGSVHHRPSILDSFSTSRRVKGRAGCDRVGAPAQPHQRAWGHAPHHDCDDRPGTVTGPAPIPVLEPRQAQAPGPGLPAAAAQRDTSDSADPTTSLRSYGVCWHAHSGNFRPTIRSRCVPLMCSGRSARRAPRRTARGCCARRRVWAERPQLLSCYPLLSEHDDRTTTPFLGPLWARSQSRASSGTWLMNAAAGLNPTPGGVQPTAQVRPPARQQICL